MNDKLKSIFIFLLPIFLAFGVSAQDLPVTAWNGDSLDKRPLIFYVSGDGGINRFSTQLCETIKNEGYDVAALNARSYFYSRKTPEQTAFDFGNYLNQIIKGRINQQIVLIGYSFGADIVPFILNRLPNYIHTKVMVSFLMASSGSTDFEIHWSDILGGNSKRKMDVVSEINRLAGDSIVIISAGNDHSLDINKITLHTYTREVLPGGHHFDGDTDEITKVIIKHIQQMR
jgi:type IV secretory pathway VirJ component